MSVSDSSSTSSDSSTRRTGRSASDSEAGGSHLTDTELIDRAQNAGNGEKFYRLWRGRTAGYDSHSEADMALCGILAFWTGDDPARLDRLFRQSGLYREKWDEVHFADGSTYGEKTIERVLESADTFYDPGDGSSRDTASSVDTGDRALDESRSVHTSGRSDRISQPVHDDRSAFDPSRDEPADSHSTPTRRVSDEHEPVRSQRDRPLEAAHSSGEEELLDLIEQLQIHVERLEQENRRLKRALETQTEAEAPTDDQQGDHTTSGISRLWQWFSG